MPKCARLIPKKSHDIRVKFGYNNRILNGLSHPGGIDEEIVGIAFSERIKGNGGNK